MAGKLDDYKAIILECDQANDYMRAVTANTGDINGRVIRARLTNNGENISPDGITARLYFDPNPDDQTEFGDYVDMTPLNGQPTATFDAPIPAAALTKSGRTRMGIAFSQSETDVVVTRTFDVTVEQGVLKTTSGPAVGNFEAWIRRAESAATNAEASKTAAEQAAARSEQALENIGTSKEDAAKSAAAALASENAAKTSETNAKTSEQAALASENAAKTSETNAKASENAAKTSETNAKASENAAKTSETNAKTSEQAALASENAAKTSETNAAESASQAAASDRQAGEYADQAETSATNAAASATTATQAETNALASEQAAKTSETAAAESAQEARNAVDNFGLVVDSTTTVAPGTPADVQITKDGTVYHAAFTIPQGERGENTAAISEITSEYTPGTGDPSVKVEAGGTPTDRTLKFIMSNLEGADGHTPVIAPGTTTTLDPGAQATFTATTDDKGDVTLDVGIPRGRDGSDATVTDATVSAALDQPLSTAKIKAIAGAANTQQTITFDPDDFTQDDEGLWHADKPAAGLGTVNLAAPTSTWDNVQAYAAAGPVISDHGDDQTVPADTIRCTCQTAPADPFDIRITTIIKEA